MTGPAIEAARKALGMNRTQLATAVGVSERTIYRWERDDVTISKPSKAQLERILRNGKPRRKTA